MTVEHALQRKTVQLSVHYGAYVCEHIPIIGDDFLKTGAHGQCVAFSPYLDEIFGKTED